VSQAAGTKKVAPFWGHSFKEAKKEGCQGKSKAVPFRQPERRVERCRDFWKRVKLITVAAASLVNSESALAEPKLVAQGHVTCRTLKPLYLMRLPPPTWARGPANHRLLCVEATAESCTFGARQYFPRQEKSLRGNGGCSRSYFRNLTVAGDGSQLSGHEMIRRPRTANDQLTVL
jgi:hypothetical protein